MSSRLTVTISGPKRVSKEALIVRIALDLRFLGFHDVSVVTESPGCTIPPQQAEAVLKMHARSGLGVTLVEKTTTSLPIAQEPPKPPDIPGVPYQLREYLPGQWWVKELQDLTTSRLQPTDNQRRALAVVQTLAASVFVLNSNPKDAT